jgi:hypothetical protein
MKQRRWLLFVFPIFGTLIAGMLAFSQFNAGQADAPPAGGKINPADTLPIKQVVLFNSGVGYFQREGEIDGDARIQLSFPVGDINDLLKSLVLQDSKGRIGTVNFDSSDPIDKILRSFALDLTGNPTFGQILNQARGEKIDITRADKKEGAAKVSGTIVGLEFQKKTIAKDQVIDVEILNLNTKDGLQAIPMDQIITVRFQSAALESEFNRALNVLASSHDTQKKTVSVGFHGDGKRNVRVGYVVERPIWKTTYRLRIDNNGKVFLQGWALVENTSDDDWNDVHMVLVSGKPISFRMNLYDPIYVPRPFVEPETFASLRPPVYAGSMSGEETKKMADMGFIPTGTYSQGVTSLNGVAPFPLVNGGIQNNNLTGNPTQSQQQIAQNMAERVGNKLSYDELQRRRAEQAAAVKDAKKVGEALTGFNFKEGIKSVATADEVGDYFQYAIDQKVSLARQKSAMLPILDQTIEGQKVSIYNEAVQAKHPLLGVKLKNTSGQPLTQGPITVYDGGVFGGDTRILDVQSGEERLLSYALDQSTEVKTEIKSAPSPDMIFRIGSDKFSARYYVRQTKTYTIKNRSDKHDRTVILEHPIKPDWKLLEPKKPIEQTRDLYRFQVSVPAGQLVKYEVVEDLPRVDPFGPQPLYTIASGINVKVAATVDLNKLIAVRINKGFVVPTYKTRETKAYYVQNLSDMDRNFTVDHVVRPGWARLDDDGKPAAGPEVFRFKLEIAKGKTGNQAVREERTHTDSGQLFKNLNETQIKLYMNNAITSAAVKTAFTKALAMQANITETQAQIATVKKDLDVVTTDNTRVRENLKIIPQTSEFYKPMLEKFIAQDKQIEAHQNTIRTLNATMQTQVRDYDVFLSKLDAE